MALEFEWNDEKARLNPKKHGVGFEEATTVFGDTLSVTIADPLHSDAEDRFVTTGISIQKRVLVVVFVERKGKIRIISARLATKHERKIYEEK